MSIWISQFSPAPFPLGVHTFVLYTHVSISPFADRFSCTIFLNSIYIYIYIYIYINVRHLFSSFWHFTLKSLGPPWKVLTIIFFSVLFHKIFFECLLCARHGSHLFINWSSPVAPSLQWEIDLKTKKHYTQSIPEGFQGPLLTQEWRGQCPHVLSAGLEPDLLADMLCGRWVRKVHSDYDLGRQGAGSMVR